MILLSSVVAAYKAIDRLLHPEEVNHLWAVAGAALVGFLGNELVARYRIRIGRQIGSAALVADGLHDAPMGSPAWQYCSAPAAYRSAYLGPTQWWACSSPSQSSEFCGRQ